MRDAIALAPTGETIDFDSSLDGGTILLTLGELSVTRALTIDGTSLPAGLTIDASGSDPTPDEDNADGSRVFNIDDGDIGADSPVTIAGLVLTGGDIDGNGGAISSQESLVLTHNIISGNSARRDGGGIYVTSRADDLLVTVSNSMVATNTASTGPDLRVTSAVVMVRHSLIGDNAGTGLDEAPIGMPDANGNLIGGPINGLIDPMLGPLDDNGGPTQTHALLSGSPAIGAGDPGFAPPPDFDQRGAPFVRMAGGRIDMGAHERQELTVEIVQTATPRIGPVEEVTIRFSSDVAGFDMGDLELSLNGGANLLTEGQTLTTSDNRTFVLGGLAGVTTRAGYYVLRLVRAGSEIVDAGGAPLDSGETMD